jgi:hypothetical protein
VRGGILSGTIYYVAMVDRTLAYDCASCADSCCRNPLLATDMRKEGPGLLERYPELEAFSLKRRGPLLYLGTAPGGCQLLGHDGRCSVQVSVGDGAKPGACVTFPFSPVFRVDDVVVARPWYRCPISWANESEGETAVKVVDLEETLAALDVGGWPLPLATAEEGGTKWVEGEIAFQDLLNTHSDGPAWVEELIAEQPDEVPGPRTELSRLLGTPVTRPALSRKLALLAPSLRTRMLSLPEGQRRRILLLSHDLLATLGPRAEGVGPGVLEHYLRVYLPALSFLAWLPGEAGLLPSAPQQVPADASANLKLAACVAQQELRRGQSGHAAFATAAAGLPDISGRMVLLHFLGGLGSIPGDDQEVGGSH